MAAPTNYYVDPSIAADSGTGTIGDPYGDLQYALNQVTRDSSNGDQFNIKSGADEILATSLDFTSYGTPSEAASCYFRGYTSAANDGGIGGISGNGSLGIVNTATIDYLRFIDLHCHNSGAANIFTVDRECYWYNCEINNATGRGIKSSTGTIIIDCHLHNIGNAGVETSNAYIANCTFENGTNDFVWGVLLSGDAGPGVVINNIMSLDGTSIGVYTEGNQSLVIGNSIYSNGGTGSGVEVRALVHSAIVMNNVIEGFSGVGGEGLLIGSTSKVFFVGYNTFYNNTTNISNSGDTIINETANDQTPGSSPFTAAGSDDFTLVSALQALAFPTANYPNLAVRSYLDPGALQRQEAGGGGPIFGGMVIK